MSQKGRAPQKGTDDADTRIAPDPFIVVLPALSALGAITCIAAVNWAAEEKTPDRPKARRKASAALRDLESCCLGLQEIFKRFMRHPRLFAGEGAAASSPLKFGVHGPRITPDEVRTFQQLMNDTASMMVLAAQNAIDVMAAVEDGELDPPEEIFYAFGDAQNSLNALIQERATMKETVERGARIAKDLTVLVAQLKTHRAE